MLQTTVSRIISGLKKALSELILPHPFLQHLQGMICEVYRTVAMVNHFTLTDPQDYYATMADLGSKPMHVIVPFVFRYLSVALLSQDNTPEMTLRPVTMLRCRREFANS